MRFSEFKTGIYDLAVFSPRDIRKQFPGFDRRRLSEWQDRKLIVKIRNGWYCFPEYLNNNKFLWLIANKIHSPSYLSLETALSWYEVIPEGVFSSTSITTNKTERYSTVYGSFYYNSIKPELYFGYKLISIDSNQGTDQTENRFFHRVKVAEMEKAILDFFYINTQYHTESDILELRFNDTLLHDELEKPKLYEYLTKFENKNLERRIFTLFKVIQL
jgi:predicted transcriptional regulator of viral defense system